MLALVAPALADPFYGANVGGVWAYPQAQQQVQLDALAAAGIKIGRFDVNWGAVEPQPGLFDWAQTDLQMTELAQAGIEPYPILDKSPAWDRVYGGAPPGMPSDVPASSVAPADPVPFATFAAAFAQRYGVGGSFATAAADPVHDYEVWNEEDEILAYYPTDAGGYAALYRDARAALKAVDPTATVVMGGLAAVWLGNAPRFNVDPYAKAAIAAIGYCPDSVGYHGYPLTTAGLFSSLTDFRSVLDTAGCTRTPIELNEYNYAGTGSAAANVADTASTLAGSRLGADRMMPYPAVDENAYVVPTLIDQTGALTVVGQAYSAVARANPVPLITWPRVSSAARTGPGSPFGVGQFGQVGHETRCPAATGSLGAESLGLVRLGMTRAWARRRYPDRSSRGKHYEDFFCLTPIGVRVGYASPRLLEVLPLHQRPRLAGRVVWASTANEHYARNGIRIGTSIRAASMHLEFAAPFHIGLNDWYLSRNRTATAILKVRDDVVREIGIANRQVTATRTAQRVFLTSFS